MENKIAYFRIGISEEALIASRICDTLNKFSNPKEFNGFKFHIKNERFTISVYRCRNSFSSFEVSFKITQLEDESILVLNSLFRRCILNFSYDPSNNEFNITILDKYCDITMKQTKSSESPDSLGESEKVSYILSLRKAFPEISEICNLLNMVKIKKILTINKNLFTVAAIGRQTAIAVKFHIVTNQDNMTLPAFCSKFNFLSAQSLADFNFGVISTNLTDLLQITVFIPTENDPRRDKYIRTIALLNSISSLEV